MSTSPLRSAMVPVTRQMRAYFAPVNRTTEAPTIFDPGMAGRFSLDAPPAPWIDLGWIENFVRWYETPTDVVRVGARSLPAGQFRGALEARVEFDFRQWGKLQMALACGSEHMNVLAPVAGSGSPAPSGGTPASAVAVVPGSTASELVFGPGAVSAFAVGNLLAVDEDYQQQVGYVGSGIAAAYVGDPAAVKRDSNYVRRVTFNVGRVAATTATSVLLAQPLVGGAPAMGASAQVVVGFVDREGGSFFQEWSGLFVAEEESGGRVCFYYPRLSAGKPAGKAVREDFAVIQKPLSAVSLRASFLALPYVDTNDGQTVLCYRSYLPAGMAAAY
ncbi:MAG TPA: hypothetical protein VMU05_05870 [Dongiaceae bacterium]|nr:hypothetical protein [Dongiaceae bacterium]